MLKLESHVYYTITITMNKVVNKFLQLTYK